MKQIKKKPVGRPRNKTKTARYERRIHPKLVQPMDDHLRKLKAELINEI